MSTLGKEFSRIKSKKFEIVNSAVDIQYQEAALKIVAHTEASFSFNFDDAANNDEQIVNCISNTSTKQNLGKKKKKKKKSVDGAALSACNDDKAMIVNDVIIPDNNSAALPDISSLSQHIVSGSERDVLISTTLTDEISKNINSPEISPKTLDILSHTLQKDSAEAINRFQIPQSGDNSDKTETKKIVQDIKDKKLQKKAPKTNLKDNFSKNKQSSGKKHDLKTKNDEDDDFLNEAIAAVKLEKSQMKPGQSKPAVKSMNQTFIAPFISHPSSGETLRFLSPKDPEITQDQKDKLKYGNAKNLVAIGPTRVRASNWINKTDGKSVTSSLEGKNDSICDPSMNSLTSTVSSPFSFGFDAFSEFRNAKS